MYCDITKELYFVIDTYTLGRPREKRSEVCSYINYVSFGFYLSHFFVPFHVDYAREHDVNNWFIIDFFKFVPSCFIIIACVEPKSLRVFLWNRNDCPELNRKTAAIEDCITLVKKSKSSACPHGAGKKHAEVNGTKVVYHRGNRARPFSRMVYTCIYDVASLCWFR